MKKKSIAWLLVAMLLTVIASPAALADGGIHVTVNNVPVVWTDAEPFIDANNRTLCPLRAVGEAMGLDVQWDPDTRVASFVQSGYNEDGTSYTYTLSFPIDSTTAHWDESHWDAEGQIDYGGIGDIEMDTAAVIVNGRTYAPVRYLAEAFGYYVDWDAETKTVVIEENPGYIICFEQFTLWPDVVGIYFYPGERFDEYGSVEVVSATVDGVPAEVEVFTASDLQALNDEFVGNAVYAFYIYGTFESGQTYSIKWSTSWIYADGTESTEPTTTEWTYSCDGFGGW